jgi:hypothetical protein
MSDAAYRRTAMPPAAVVAVLFAAGATAAAAPARPRARAEVAVAAPQQPQAPWPGIAELPAHVREHGLQADVEALAGAITTWADRLGGSKASQLARNAFADPLGAPAALLATTDRLDAALRAEPPELHEALAEARAFLALPAPAAARSDEFEPTLLGVKALLAAAQKLVEDALGAIEPADRAELRAGLVTLLDDYLRSIYIHEAKDHDNKRTWKKLQRVDAAGMHAAAELLLPLLQPKVHNALAAALRKELANAPPPPAVPGVTGRLLYAEATPHGWILVGSTDANVYDARIAFAIDLGGNDTWRAPSTRSDVGVPINVVIDLAGDDRYLAGEPFAQGCGLFGVSLLGEAAGKDLYEAQRGAQGAAFAGIGVLLDAQGDDRFAGDAFAQGIALHGTGLLLDRAGNDAMTLGSDGQGYGLPQGVGVLADLAGNDQRTATGVRKSTYGTDGEFVGRAQGTAFGFRTVAPGGLGALLDGGGKDVNTVGEFGFGCGYFFGVGVVRDRGGDDQTFASRYGIATGAHHGVGAVFDDAGNDLWDNRHTASLAGNWDLTVSVLFDRAGDDRYLGDGITLGSSTITSFAALVDGGGKDVYETGSDLAFARCGHADDVGRGSRSIALFLDLGGGKDSYPATSPLQPPPGNGSVAVRTREDAFGEGDAKKTATSGKGVFVDR